jgi:ketosteroid isomerase-like protein
MSRRSPATTTRPATTSSEEITARLKRLIEAFNRGDYEGATEIAHPEVEMVRTWEKSSLHGAEALREWLKPDAFHDQQGKLLAVTVVGDKALVHNNLRARGATSGIEVDVDSWAVWTFDADGLVTRVEFFLNHEEDQARAAAGIPA